MKALAAGEIAHDTFTVQVTDDQGTSTTTPATFTVTGVNDAPTLNLNGGNPVVLNYTENDPGTPIAASATLGDIDSANFNDGSLRISLGRPATATIRSPSPSRVPTPARSTPTEPTSITSNVVIGTYSGGDNGNDLLINFTSDSATQAAAQALLRDIYYTNYSDDPTAGARTATFTLIDGDGTANGGHDTGTANATINVTAVNDAPVNTVSGARETTRTAPSRSAARISCR